MNEFIIKILSLIENLLINPLIWIFPIKWSVVPPGSSAIRFTFGSPGPDLKTGIHFATFGQTLQKKHVNTKWATAESMKILTEDGVLLKIRGVVIYRIVSLAKYLTAAEYSDDFVTEACEAAIKYAISMIPFEDLISDSDTVEGAISEKISEICNELGIEVKRYRFQDIELIDPIGRAFLSINAIESRFTQSIKNMSKKLSISDQNAAILLSPNIQFVSNIDPQEPIEQNINPEEENGSTRISEESP